MKKTNIILFVIIFLILSLTFFNNQYVFTKSKYQAKWQQLVENKQKLVEKEEKNIKARFELGVAYANLGKIDLAKKEFDALKSLDNNKRIKEIIDHYETQINKEPDNLIFLNYLGFVYYANQDFKQALEVFKKIIEFDSKNIWSYNYLGTIHGKLKQYEKAEEILKKSLKLEKNKYTHFLLGAIYYKQGNVFKAFYHIGNSGQVATKLLNW